MSHFRGFSARRPLQVASSENIYISTSLHTADEVPDQDIFRAVKVLTQTSASKEVQSDTTPTRTNYPENAQQGFLTVFDNSLHYIYQGGIIDGTVQDRGVTTTDVSVFYGIWNNFSASNTIEQISVTPGQGVQIVSPPAGTVFTPRQELPMEVLLETEGPTTFLATITIKFVGRPELYTFSIRGLRLFVPYLLSAEWARGMSVTKRYLTSVHSAFDNTESRVSTRSNPTREIKADLFFGTDTSALQAWTSLYQSTSTQFVFPYVPDKVDMTQATSGQTVYLPTANRRFFVGNLIEITAFNTDGSVKFQEALTIDELYADRVVVREPIVNTYLAGDAVFPAMICLPALSGSRINPTTGTVGRLRLRAKEAYGKAMLGIENSSYTPTEKYSHPVYPFEINWRKRRRISAFRLGNVDSSGSGQKYYTLGDQGGLETQATSTMFNREQSWEANGFFNYVRGRGKAFWMKSLLDTFPLIDIVGGGGSIVSIFIEPVVTEVDLRYLKYVWVENASNEYDIVKVTSIVENHLDVTIVTEATSISGITKAHVAVLGRMAKDSIAEKYITDEVSEIVVRVKETVGEYE